MGIVVDPAPGGQNGQRIENAFRPGILRHVSRRDERSRSDERMTADSMRFLERTPTGRAGTGPVAAQGILADQKSRGSDGVTSGCS